MPVLNGDLVNSSAVHTHPYTSIFLRYQHRWYGTSTQALLTIPLAISSSTCL